MGSCFRSKKKNSYTVTQLEEEYQGSRTNFRSKSDKRYSYPVKDKQPGSTTVSTVNSDVEFKERKVERRIIENGNDTVEHKTVADPVPDNVTVKERRPSNSSTVSVKSDNVNVVVQVKTVTVEEVVVTNSVDIPQHDVVDLDDRSSSSSERQPDVAAQRIVEVTETVYVNGPEDQGHYEEAAIDVEEEQETFEATPYAEPHVTFSENTETVQGFLRESVTLSDENRHSDSDDEDRREESNVSHSTEELTTTTTTTTMTATYDNDYDDTQQTTIVTVTEVRSEPEEDDIREPPAEFNPEAHYDEVQTNPEALYDEVQITDSPAGTWDSRLNTDVSAELEEVRRSLSSSRASSAVSLDNPAPEPTAITQTVRFNVPDQQSSDDEGSFENSEHTTVVTVTETTYTTEHEQPQGQYHHEEYQVNYDNDENDRIATQSGHVFSDYEMVDYNKQEANQGEIILTEEHGVIYDEPTHVGYIAE